MMVAIFFVCLNIAPLTLYVIIEKVWLNMVEKIWPDVNEMTW